jgi:hypothetical protein
MKGKVNGTTLVTLRVLEGVRRPVMLEGPQIVVGRHPIGWDEAAVKDPLARSKARSSRAIGAGSGIA